MQCPAVERRFLEVLFCLGNQMRPVWDVILQDDLKAVRRCPSGISSRENMPSVLKKPQLLFIFKLVIPLANCDRIKCFFKLKYGKYRYFSDLLTQCVGHFS